MSIYFFEDSGILACLKFCRVFFWFFFFWQNECSNYFARKMNTLLSQFVLLIVPVYCMCSSAVHPWKYAVLCAGLQLFPPSVMHRLTFHPPYGLKWGGTQPWSGCRRGVKLPFHLFCLPDHGELNLFFQLLQSAWLFCKGWAYPSLLLWSVLHVSWTVDTWIVICGQSSPFCWTWVWPANCLGGLRFCKKKITRASSKC